MLCLLISWWNYGFCGIFVKIDVSWYFLKLNLCETECRWDAFQRCCNIYFFSSSRDLQSDCGAWLIHRVKMLRALLRHGRNATTVLPRILHTILSPFQDLTMKFCEYPPVFCYSPLQSSAIWVSLWSSIIMELHFLLNPVQDGWVISG